MVGGADREGAAGYVAREEAMKANTKAVAVSSVGATERVVGAGEAVEAWAEAGAIARCVATR